MVGESKPMQEINGFIQKVAATDSTVLITGETGTGKELVATIIHEKSRREETQRRGGGLESAVS